MQTAQVITLPRMAQQPRRALPFQPSPTRAPVDLGEVAQLRGIAHRPRRAIIACIRLLVEECGFPEPRSPRIVQGRRLRGGAAVHAGSRWDRDQVEQWFERDLPPGEAAACAADKSYRTRAALADRARALVA